MKRWISIVLTICILFTSGGSLAVNELGIELDTRAYLMGDHETGEILKSYNIDQVVEIASITKVMTYIVVMDNVISGKISLSDRLIIDEDTLSVGGSTIGLELNEVWTVDELIDASLVASANNATYKLAKHIAGSEDGFVKMMNKKAQDLGFINTVFYNSSGLPVPEIEDQNKMGVREIFEMSRYVINNYPEVLDRTSKPILSIKDKDGEYIKNTNPILNQVRGVDGLKTGWTNKAGYSLVSTLYKEAEDENEKDMRIIGIVMGPKNEKKRKETSQILMDYAIDHYDKKDFLNENRVLKSLEDIRAKSINIDTYPREGFEKIVNSEETTGIKLEYSENISLPIKANQSMGKVYVLENGEPIFETDIIVKEDINKTNIVTLVFRSIFSFIMKGLNIIIPE